MKITSQLLKNAAVEPLKQVKILDLSGKRIGGIQCLEVCRQLQTLILHTNAIDTICNLDRCRELWNIDVSGNKVRNLDGLSQFPFLGTLSLSANTLDWSELRKLSHLRILSLSLNGNPKLTKDKHYRKHVIDLLPNVWMLDGQLITATERKQTQQFFISSATTSHPVRHKFSSQLAFVPSFRKNLTVTGVFGRRTSSVMTKFPLQEIHNIELDRRRLIYLAEMLEEDMKVESEYRKSKDMKSFTPPQIKTILEHRNEEIEQTNMLLLLLVALLMFNIPEELLTATFDIAKLTSIGHVKCIDLLSLPRSIILRLSSLLLSAVAIDKDGNKDGGLYPQLYHAIQISIHSLHGKPHLLDINPDSADYLLSSTSSSLSTTTSDTLSRSTTPSISSSSCSTVSFLSSSHSPHSAQPSMETICLLASEVVHLMCLVPMFFELLEIDQDVIHMVAIATRNNDVVDVVNHIKWNILDNGGNVWDVYQQIATYLLQSTTANVFSKRKVPSFKLLSPSASTALSHSSSHLYQSRKHSRVTPPPRSQSAGAVSSFRRRHMTPHQPELGDLILCAPERLARIIALPEQHVAVLQLCSPIQGMSGPPDSYFYTDTQGLQWDRTHGYWTRDDLSSDLSVDRLHSDVTQTDGTQSPSGDHTRPMSQLSYISDDLPTIPSVEEMSIENESVLDILKEENEEGMNDLPISISISGRQSLGSQRTNTPEIILEEEDISVVTGGNVTSIDSKDATFKENIESGRMTTPDEKPPLTYEQWVIDKHLSGSLTDGQDIAHLSVPVPKLIHPAVWESSKSIPSTRLSMASKKPHSCSKKDVTTPSTNADPLSSHTTPRSPSPTLTLMPFNESKPTLVHAWTTPKLGHQPKQTSVSKNRKTNKSSSALPSSPVPTPLPSANPSVVLLPLASPPSSSSSSLLTVPQNTPTHTSPVHTIHSMTTKHRYHFQPIKKKQNITVARKLGDLKSLSVFGATAW